MAILEITASTSISTYEVGDAGVGVTLAAAERDGASVVGGDKWVCLAFGNRDLGDFPGEELVEGDYRARRKAIEAAKRMPIQQAITTVGEFEGWTTVKLNGSVIWSSEAVEAVKEALEEPEFENEDDEDVFE